MDTRSGPLAIAGAGSLGPRLAGRLTAELILRSPQYMNCCKMYEIELRGNKIAEIENLGATEVSKAPLPERNPQECVRPRQCPDHSSSAVCPGVGSPFPPPSTI
mmetsp:Transcript_42242/g.100205  ORF Transcript_42242/g.100205 Transcript_42242/m.100205 type:complete len:104 (+) Transcript_42242:234-545(+)